MGMVRTFQLTKVMGKLTVMENMRLGASNQPGERLSKALFKGMWGGREKEITAQADVLLEKFKLDAKKDDYAASLSGGQRKLLEMATLPHGPAQAGDARRAHGRRQPGTDPVPAGPHQEPQGRGHDRAVR